MSRTAPIGDVAFRARFSDGTVSRSYATVGPAKAAITSRVQSHGRDVARARHLRSVYARATAPAYMEWAWTIDSAAPPTGVVERSVLAWEVVE